MEEIKSGKKRTHWMWYIFPQLKNGKKAKELAKEVIRLLLAYRADGVLTITTDNGPEFSRHQMITKALKGVVVYFADPYASWQKGLVEYTNKLIRQYTYPKALISTILARMISWVSKRS